LKLDKPTVHSKADIDENEERSAHKISTIPVNAINHGKDGPTVHNKANTDVEVVKKIAKTVAVYPGAKSLFTTQHRGREKALYSA
jgi:hypothetical protein